MGSSGGRGDLGFSQGLGPPTQSVDLSRLRNVGITPWESWYFSGGLTLTPVAPSINFIYAMPYPTGRGGHLDRIGFSVTTGGAAGSVGRCGIYMSDSNTSLHPGALVVDGGEKDCTSIAVKSSIIDVDLPPDSLAYLCVFAGVAAPTLQYTTGQTLTLGLKPDFSGNITFCFFGTTYGPLPRTFPKVASFLGGSVPLVAVRYSA